MSDHDHHCPICGQIWPCPFPDRLCDDDYQLACPQDSDQDEANKQK